MGTYSSWMLARGISQGMPAQFWLRDNNLAANVAEIHYCIVIMKGPKIKERGADGNGSLQCNLCEPKPQDFIERKIKSIKLHALNLSAAAKWKVWQAASGKWQQQKPHPQSVGAYRGLQDCAKEEGNQWVFQALFPPIDGATCNLWFLDSRAY